MGTYTPQVYTPAAAEAQRQVEDAIVKFAP